MKRWLPAVVVLAPSLLVAGSAGAHIVTFYGAATAVAAGTATSTTFSSEIPASVDPECVGAGDCDRSGSVTIDDLLTMVNVALGDAPTTSCEAGEVTCDDRITIDEIVVAVNNGLTGGGDVACFCCGLTDPDEQVRCEAQCLLCQERRAR
ncbi:hypothetical protein L6Q96_04100 [Candidatus Binatia bacterium]|nr:hypothetical protein [Candidatus Binatia bacterium]